MIRGQVAQVLSSRQLVINRGLKDGVKVGMRFEVLDPSGENINDPETGAPLASLALVKVRVEAVQVEREYSIVATYERKSRNVGGLGLGTGLSALFEPMRIVDEYVTFKQRDIAWEPLAEAESYVKRGDPVVEIGEARVKLDDPEIGHFGTLPPVPDGNAASPEKGLEPGATPTEAFTPGPRSRKRRSDAAG